MFKCLGMLKQEFLSLQLLDSHPKQPGTFRYSREHVSILLESRGGDVELRTDNSNRQRLLCFTAEWQDRSLIGRKHHEDSENGRHGIILSAETNLGR